LAVERFGVTYIIMTLDDLKQRTYLNQWISNKYEAGLVSVIIPTYNRADKVGATLASVFAQSYRPLEVIVVDDGSTDNTQHVVEQLANEYKDDATVQVVFLRQENRYAPAARNYGLVESRGEFIQFLDSDDLISPSKIRLQVEHIRGCDENTAVYGPWHCFIVGSEGIRVGRCGFEIHELDALENWIVGWWYVPQHCLLYRRNQVREMGPWDETLAADQDGEYSMRFLLRGGKLAYCPEAWSYYRLNAPSSNSTGAANRRESFISRCRVTARIEDEITTKGLLDKYRGALSLRYAGIALRCALYHKDIADRCLDDARRLSRNGTLPDIFTYPLLTRLLGLTLKQRTGRLVRSILRIPPREFSPSDVFEVLLTVTRVEDVYKLENPEALYGFGR
jgi:glycosyltransferase involved in cell wall biosynthesis